MDPEAQAEFQELMDMLKQAMTETFFKDLQQQISNMTPEDMERMKQMMRDLNKMMQDRKFIDDSYYRLRTEKIFEWAEGQVQREDAEINADEFEKMVHEHQHEH